MITVTKTNTRGFRAERFRNQLVHQYYGHLQSVMHSIEPSDIYKNLFARPEIDEFSSENSDIEWTSALSGRPVHYSQLPEQEKEKVNRFISEAFVRINNYIAESKNKTGKERDYSQFLTIVGKKPHPNQIWIIGGKPTIVQWGYNDENNLMGSSGIYPNWDSFISEIHTAPEEKTVTTETISPAKQEAPVEETSVAIVPSELFNEPVAETPKNQEKQPEVKKEAKQELKQEEKKMVMAGLGGYWWVKWLAIILLIIIIILLLLRLLPQNNYPFGSMPGMGGAPTVINGGSGGMGGGAGGAGGPEGNAGGDNSGIGPNGGNNGNDTNKAGEDNSSQKAGGDSEEVCPVCKNKFAQHSSEDLKKCLLNAQEGKEEMKKRLQKFVNDFDVETADNSTDKSADNKTDKAAENSDKPADKAVDNTADNTADKAGEK